jgi:predicted deacylase
MSGGRDGVTFAQPVLPAFDVRLKAPDLSPWIAGNIGLPGFTMLRSDLPGPHIAVLALTHGNEIAGAILLDRLLREQIRPLRGTLTFGFANLAAFARFDPAQPTASRFVDEDLNRVWDIDVLEGPRETCETMRARQMRKLVDSADILLDLHSMLWPSDPLMLCGVTAKGRAMAEAIGAPDLIVADEGHVSGKRIIDYGPFADPATAQMANLIEAGQHWQPSTVAMTARVTMSLLQQHGMVHASTVPSQPSVPRIAEVSHAITAATASFAFVQVFRGGDVIEKRHTLIAVDGTTEIRTPHDNCLLVMPSLRPSRGHTAVRLARFVG